MIKRIDSTFYFFQYLVARLMIIVIIGLLIYNIIMQEIGAIIFCFLALLFFIFILIKQVPKPYDLCFDEKLLHLESQSKPIEIKNISGIENGVILYKIDEKVFKIPLPKYYFIDKNYKELKSIIESKSTQQQKHL